MIILSINMCGSGSEKKRQTLQGILHKYRVQFVSIQESFLTSSNAFRVKSIWCNFGFDYAESLARGHSGGLLSIWDPMVFSKESVMSFDNFLVVKGRWLADNVDAFMMNVYAPQGEPEKRQLWLDILSFINSNPGKYIIHGDFNAVRKEDERLGTIFSKTNAFYFN